MRLSTIRFVVAATLIALAMPAVAQTVIPVPTEEAGRDKSGDEPYDVPELYGTRPVERGSGLELPRLLVEYSSRAQGTFQRLAIFENGVAAIHVTNGSFTTRKKLVLPDESMKLYRAQVEKLPIELIPVEMERDRKSEAVLRIGREAIYVERRFPATSVLPMQIENFRGMLLDLLDAIASDRQVTNPVTTYVPKKGDRLISEDGQTFKIVRIANEGTIVELEEVGKPTRMFVPAELLYTMFVEYRTSPDQ